ncbi:aminodeoxychorismate synthase component I [Myroides sp. LJL116]
MSIKDTTIHKMNELGKARIPFIFILDYKGQNNIVLPLDEVNADEILFDFQGVTNKKVTKSALTPSLKAYPLSFESYKEKFDKIKDQLKLGNSYLTNLTIQTPIDLKGSLLDVYSQTKARYKVYLKENFTCFSPETFIQIHQNTMECFPMKGTIDATIENAQEILLNDPKEKAEHYTIVDLIRNDLSIVGQNTKVESFAYLDLISTSKGPILQMSSKISTQLQENWQQNIGDIFNALLPAGSITGSPKQKTQEIIQDVEQYDRDFYTGVCGIFNGETLDSGVMIRFIQQNKEQFYYKSGGGITLDSQCDKEYQELLQKIYIPF